MEHRLSVAFLRLDVPTSLAAAITATLGASEEGAAVAAASGRPRDPTQIAPRPPSGAMNG